MAKSSGNASAAVAGRLRPRSQIFFAGPGRTKQSFKDECNVNHIMAKYTRTGVIEHGNAHRAQYGEVPAIEYRQALDAVMKAEALFDSLPAGIRRRFDNQPGKFLDFCDDPANRDEAGELGLLEELQELPPPIRPADPPEPPPGPPGDPEKEKKPA